MQCKRKDCKYRSENHRIVTCDYFLITGELRGCPIEDCDKYEKGVHGGFKDSGYPKGWRHEK